MRQLALPSVVLALSLIVNSSLFAQTGTWTQLTTPNPSSTGGSGVAILLTDGSVMVCGSNAYGVSNTWTKLTPDSTGSYVNGTWSSIASMQLPRLYFAANVLPSGKVFVMGGEYSGFTGSQTLTNQGEIYDPVANQWTAITQFPKGSFGDDPTVLLPSGKILCGYIFGPQTYLYDPIGDSWSQTGTKLLADRSDEESWVLLPDSSVLSYNIFASPAAGPGSAQRYNPSAGRWASTGTVPVPLTGSAFGFELGPALLLPDGRVFQLGANNNSVLYSPQTDTWTQGPSLPAKMGCDDAPAAMMPNGKVLFIADTSSPSFTAPSKVYEFDPQANTFTDVTPTGALGTILANTPSFQYSMLMLPSGQVMLSCAEVSGANIWIFTPTGTPSAAWAPTITSLTKVSGNTYRLTGTQLNGISEGSSYGDDVENSTNYPIVKFTNAAGTVKYLRSTNWSPGLVATGSRQTSCNFDLPAGTNNGIYQISVSANGISSANKTLAIGPVLNPSNVIATYNAGTRTLSLTGDANDNSFTVSVQAGNLTVEGANGTTINNTTTFKTATSGALTIVANLNDGNDSMSIIGVNSSSTTVNLGSGNNKLAVTLSHVTTLTVNGGTGTDTLLTTSSTIGTLNKTQVP